MGTLRLSLWTLALLSGLPAAAQHGGSLTSGTIGGDVGAVFNTNDARNQIIRENSAQLQQLQAEKLQAQNAAGQCAVNYQKAIADINAQQAQQQAQQNQNNAQQAAQNAGNTINDVANNLQNGGLKEGRRGKAEMAAAEAQAKDLQNIVLDAAGEKAAKDAVTISKSSVTPNVSYLMRLCQTNAKFRETYNGGPVVDANGLPVNSGDPSWAIASCKQEVRTQANIITSRWNAGRVARDGGQSIVGMIGSALLNGLGTIAGQKLAQKPQQQLQQTIGDGQKQSAEADKANCEAQAAEMVANVDRQIDEAQKSGQRSLADAEQAGKLANMINRNKPVLAGSGAGGTVNVDSSGVPIKAPTPFPQPKEKAAGGGGGGAAVAGGGGGSGGSGEIPYTFPSNAAFGSGPTGPLTPADYEVAGGGGGGMFGGGDMGFADAAPVANFDNGSSYVADAGQMSPIGDGGIYVLMARMRTQLANNAEVLVKQMKLDTMASLPPSSSVAPRSQ